MRCARRSPAGWSVRPCGHTSARPYSAAGRRLRRQAVSARSSSRSARATSASTRSRTRWRSCRARSRRCRCEDARFDVVLCAQVLEHCDDPAQAIEGARAGHGAGRTGPRLDARRPGVPPFAGGLLALDARGPGATVPARTREWASVSVVPASGTTACVGMLDRLYLDLATRRARTSAGSRRPLIAAINSAAEAVDSRSARLREPGPGTLFANYHVVARGARVSRKVLVTGGGGFIGSNLVRGLLERGDEVRVLDNFATGNRAQPGRARGRRRGRRGRAAKLRTSPQRRPRRRGRLPPGRSAVGAALGAGSADDERRHDRGNAQRAPRRARRERRRVVFASSSSVYGNSGTLPRVESQQPDPISPYARGEARGRAVLRQLPPRLRARDGRTPLLQRLRAAAGPERPSTPPSSRASSPRSRTATRSPIHGDGTQSRDFTYVATSSRRTCSPARARRRRRRRAQHRDGPASDASTSWPTRSAPCSGRPVEKEYLAAADRRRARLVGRRRRGPAGARLRGRGQPRGGPRLTADACWRAR